MSGGLNTSAAQERHDSHCKFPHPMAPNGPKLTGLAPHGMKSSTGDPAGCGDKSGAAPS